MARKPAIDGLARPQGVLDDIVRPIIVKTAGKLNKAIYSRGIQRTKGDSTKVIHSKAFRATSRVEHAVSRARQKSYQRAARIANAKDNIKKESVKMAKARAAGNPRLYSVRKAAKGARMRKGYR